MTTNMLGDLRPHNRLTAENFTAIVGNLMKKKVTQSDKDTVDARYNATSEEKYWEPIRNELEGITIAYLTSDLNLPLTVSDILAVIDGDQDTAARITEHVHSNYKNREAEYIDKVVDVLTKRADNIYLQAQRLRENKSDSEVLKSAEDALAHMHVYAPLLISSLKKIKQSYS